MTNLKTLHAGQRLDALGCVEQAIVQVRAVIKTAPNVGPILVASYRALSVLGELREVVDSMPVVREEPA